VTTRNLNGEAENLITNGTVYRDDTEPHRQGRKSYNERNGISQRYENLIGEAENLITNGTVYRDGSCVVEADGDSAGFR